MSMYAHVLVHVHACANVYVHVAVHAQVYVQVHQESKPGGCGK